MTTRTNLESSSCQSRSMRSDSGQPTRHDDDFVLLRSQPQKLEIILFVEPSDETTGCPHKVPHHASYLLGPCDYSSFAVGRSANLHGAVAIRDPTLKP